MRKPKTIQITLPNPCHEDWEKMTLAERGRFCNHCQKTVIDFTTWTDGDLFNFFIKDGDKTCGRFTNLQLDRNLTIPIKQSNFIYRIAIALGLTSLLTQIPTTSQAQHVVHKYSTHSRKLQKSKLPAQISGIRGHVRDQYNGTMPEALIDIYDDKEHLVASVKSDGNGCYQIDDLAPCTYRVVTSHSNKIFSKETQDVIVKPGEYTSTNLLIRRPEIEPRVVITNGGPMPITISTYTKHKWHPFRFLKRKKR